MAEAWHYNKRALACGQCETPFADGAAFFSLLRFDADEIVRGDWCPRCFDSRQVEDDLVYWRATHRLDKAALRLDFELLLGVLEPLSKDQRESRRDLAFLLALLLVRHRKLRLTGVKRSKEVEFLELRKVRSTATFEVEVRELDEARRNRLTAVLTDLMDPTQDGGAENWFEVPQAEESVD
jgi:hypothetical protein